MKSTKFLMAIAIATTVGFVSCKPKDADVKTALEEKVKAATELAGITVSDVKEGVASLTGEFKDSAAYAKANEVLATLQKDVKGLKSFTNNFTVAPAVVPASVNTVLDAATQQKVKDGLKDFKGVKYEFVGDKVLLTGSVTMADRMKIMKMLGAAKVKFDPASNLVNVK
ncbi:hypothetical protein ACQ33O_08905 [Ferruginibacter sp. SUN002]|uniref:hypothetical protein n=1 Tax=Ferruginibacter sp. SUN002 TaxID=2937789 RepID=UPI003D364CEE